MRILIANDQHWPMVSGVATAARTLAQGLGAAGHDVLVIAPSQTGKRHEEDDGNYHISRTRSVPFPARQNLRISVEFQNEIKRIIETFGPDIVHVHTQFTVGLTALRIAKKLDIPVVATNHTMPENIIENIKILLPLAKPVSYILKEYGPLLYKGAEHIIMPTQSAIDMFPADSWGNVPVTAVSNGIDLSHFKPGKVPKAYLDSWNLPTDRPILLYLGRLDGEKHVDVLVKAAASLLVKQPLHVLVVGTGNAEAGLKTLAQELGVAEHFTFPGRVSDADRAKLLRSATLFVMPSPAELQSLATLEAMASGLPVVAANAGALDELCHDGQNGYLFETDNADDLTKQLTKILTDPEQRRHMAEESLRIAGTHELTHVITQFEEIYASVLARHREKQPKAARGPKGTS
jgi:glycosyltransferase involved in cell wall biosynthesis